MRPVGVPVTKVRATSVREHDGEARTYAHVLEIDTIDMDARHESMNCWTVSSRRQLKVEGSSIIGKWPTPDIRTVSTP